MGKFDLAKEAYEKAKDLEPIDNSVDDECYEYYARKFLLEGGIMVSLRTGSESCPSCRRS